MAMNVGELNYSLGIEDNTKADMAKAKAALRKLEEQGATIPVDADIGKLTSSLGQAERALALNPPPPVKLPAADTSDIDAGASEGETSLVDMVGGWTGAGIIAAGALGVALGMELVDQFFGAIERDAGRDRLAAALGLSGAGSERAGAIAGGLYANAYGDSLGQVNEALAAVSTTIAPIDSWATTDAELTALTAKALDFAAVFGTDVTEAVAAAGSMVQRGIATDGANAFDLMVASMQKVPSAMRGDFMDAVEEYSDEIMMLGFSGEEAMAMLVGASKKGPFWLDKTGDAMKELTIRGTDMSATSVAAYEAAGLSAEDMAAKILAGGPAAKEAMSQIAKGLLSIKDPTARANAAIALFGTPLEDLGVSKIPEFLTSLGTLEGGFGGVEGAADDMGATLNDNLATDIESIKRKLSPSNLIDAFQTGGWDAVEEQISQGIDGLGAVWDEYGPEIEKGLDKAKEKFGEWWDKSGQPMLDEVGVWWDETAQPWLGEKMGEALSAAGEAALQYLKDKITDPQFWADTIVGPMVTEFTDAMEAKREELSGALTDWLEDAAGDIATEAEGMWDAIPDEFERMIGEIITAWSELELTLPEFTIPGTDTKVGGGKIGFGGTSGKDNTFGKLGGKLGGIELDIPGFATGGVVDAPIGAGVLALVHGGETIRTPAQEATVGGGTTITVPVSVDARGISDPASMAGVVGRRLGWEMANLG